MPTLGKDGMRSFFYLDSRHSSCVLQTLSSVLYVCWVTKCMVCMTVSVGCCNHFLSPAGNTGYSVLVKCSKKIVQSLSEEPKAIALQLLSARLITPCILEKTNELNETKREKASRLYTTLLGVVEHYPHKYHEFISILTPNLLHTDLLTELETLYKSM